jgi:RNA polymerase sigma-70 factor, ECF subfamily
VLTDGEVIELVGANRRDVALAAILQTYRRKVFGLAYSYVRNRAAAEDVAQEVFIRIWRALPSYDARASLATWIYTIARNASLSALRRRRREVQLEEGRGAPTDRPRVDSALPESQVATDSVESAAENASLRRLVDRLPDRQRQVVMLYYIQDESVEEVAAMLAIPVGTVKTLLHRARERLSAAAGAADT